MWVDDTIILKLLHHRYFTTFTFKTIGMCTITIIIYLHSSTYRVYLASKIYLLKIVLESNYKINNYDSISILINDSF